MFKPFSSILFLFFLISVNGQNPIGITYHNVTARYNGYFIAKERIAEVEQSLYDRFEWNYNDILPIYPLYDTVVSKSFESQLKDCIEKASIAIQRHPESRWEDDAYILVGKARMYGSEFPDAIETFKWVNTNGDDRNDQHKALVNLHRTFTEAKEYRNAEAVSDYLSKEQLTEENELGISLNRAYYFQKIENLEEMKKHLRNAESLMEKGMERARIRFILGQVQQALKNNDAAASSYKKALKDSKTYELSFFSNLNLAQVSGLSDGSNVKKNKRYFQKLLKDPKNLEYRDRIYYEMGQFELKQGLLKEALSNYSLAAGIGKDNRQKSLAFLSMAQIYYDSLKDFQNAKLYYDSTLQILDPEAEGIALLKVRQEVLDEFVGYYTTLTRNDSLIRLTKISKSELNGILEKELNRLELENADEKERKKKERRQAIISTTSNSTYNEANQVTISQEFEGDWYFYNTASLSKGISEFKRIWGNRTLEDNWRRSNKTGITREDLSNGNSPNSSQEIPKMTKAEEAASLVFNREKERETLMASLPSSESEINGLLGGIEKSYYELGKIYNFQLLEKENAIRSFDSLISRFPESELLPEVHYQLYLLRKNNDPIRSKKHSETLLREYPESVYAKLIVNPNYIEESKRKEYDFQRIYERAFDLFENGNYTASLRMSDSSLTVGKGTEVEDHLALLKVLNHGEIDGKYKYQFELNNFISNYPESDLTSYAKELVLASEEFQINLFSSSRAKYISYFTTEHYYIYLYPIASKQSDNIYSLINSFIRKESTEQKAGNLVLDENYAIILVDIFPDRKNALTFKKSLDEHLKNKSDIESDDSYSLIITKDNFDIFYETKDLESYQTFFNRYYQ